METFGAFALHRSIVVHCIALKLQLFFKKRSGFYQHSLHTLSVCQQMRCYSMKPVNMLARSLNSAVVWLAAAAAALA